jgi:hypothetical protein
MDIWVWYGRFEDCGRGVHNVMGNWRVSYSTSPSSPTVAVDNFRGLFTLATCILMPVETKADCRFELRGDGSGASLLALNNQF